MILIKNVRYFDGNQIVNRSNVVVSGTKISGILSDEEIKHPAGYDEIIDGKGRLLVPGFIDIHIHGCSGCDVMDATPEALMKIAQTLAENGTTSFLPTTVTMSKQATQNAIQNIRNCMEAGTGANILGVHLEGPLINKDRKGAQNEIYILDPSVNNFKDFVDDNLQGIKRVTLAPEVGEGIALTKYLAENGICVSAGHTCASAEVFGQSVDAGLRLCTHLFNGMNPLHHREPGVVGSVFLNDDVYAEFIADLVHIDKDVLRLIAKVKGSDKCVLITDALSSACLGDGTFSLGGQVVIVKDGIARIESGSLAGSIIMMKDAVRNMVQTAGIDLVSALKMATVNPAKVIGVDHYKGSIKEGYDADLNLLNDDLDIDMTMVMGKIISHS